MKQKPLYITIIMCLLTMTFTACDSNEPENNDHGISAALSWADKDDTGTPITDARVWIFQADGKLVTEKHYSTKQEVALDIHAVDAGEYKVVTAINLITPFSVDKATTYDELLLKLSEANASPTHAYYSVADVKALADKNTRAPLPLRRIMAELNIEIDGVPEGATLATSVTDAADGIYPLQKDAESNYGVAMSGHKNAVVLPSAIMTKGNLVTPTTRLMPTVGDASHSHLHFLFTLTDGTTRECDAEAPVMKSGGKYVLKFKYTELKPYMYIIPVKISDWEEDWTVNGEILNPVS